MGLSAHKVHKAYNSAWFCTSSKNHLRPLMALPNRRERGGALKTTAKIAMSKRLRAKSNGFRPEGIPIESD